jgi:hypothetical protein
MDSDTPNLIRKYRSGMTRLGLLRVLAVLGFAVGSFSAARAQITLEQQIGIIRAKYKTAKPVSSDAKEEMPTLPQLYSVKIGDKYGYMDASGHIVIAPKFEWASSFSEDLALVEIPGKNLNRGFIDRTGKVLFRANFPSNEQYNNTTVIPTTVDSFYDGLALVEIRDQRSVSFFGFIDRKGTLTIAADFEEAKRFSEGVAAIRIASPDDFSRFAAGFLLPNGQFAIEPTFEDTDSFSEELAAAEDRSTRKWGYIDHHGSFVIPAQFDRAWQFSQGLALVEKAGKRQFINKSGAIMAGPYATAYPFSEGSAAVNVGGTLRDWGNRADFVIGGKWGYIGLDGKFIISPKFDWALPFSEGLAAVNVGGTSSGGNISGGKWGFIDVHGSYQINPTYDGARRFSGGIAGVDVDTPGSGLFQTTSSHYIDKTGKAITPK